MQMHRTEQGHCISPLKDICGIIPMRTISVSGNSERCLGPVFSTIYEVGSIQFSVTVISDGYFHFFLKNKVTYVVPTNSDSDVIYCLQLLRKTLACTLHLS